MADLAHIALTNEELAQFWERLVRKIPRLTGIDYQTFDRAYRQAWFVHCHKARALDIVAEAATALQTCTQRQKNAITALLRRRDTRNRAYLSKAQQLQWLVCLKSQHYEQAQEQDGSTALSDEDGIVRLVEYLVSETFKHNAFYAALGIAVELYGYSITEAFEMHSWTDPNNNKDKSFWYNRLKHLREKIDKRFNHWQRGTAARAPAQMARLAELLECWLQLLTPWETKHITDDPAQWPQGSEIERIHAFLDPPCLAELAASLDLPVPGEQLRLPQFIFANHSNNEPPFDRRWRPPSLNLEDVTSFVERMHHQKRQRQAAVPARLTVLVDGLRRLEWNLERDRRVRLPIRAEAKLIEVVATAEDLLLATHLLSGDELEAGAPATRAVVILEGGQRLAFKIAPASQVADDTAVEIAYRETNLWRAVALWWRRLQQRSTEPLALLAFVIKPALVMLLAAVCVLGLVRYLQARRPAQQAPLVAEKPSHQEPIPLIGVAPTVEPSPAVSPSKRRHPSPRPQPHLPDSQLAQQPLFTEPDAGDATRGKLRQKSDALAAIKQIYVEEFDATPAAKRLREQLINELPTSGQFAVSTASAQANAVLKGSISEHQRGVTVRLRLVNRAGEVLWQREQTSGTEVEAVQRLIGALRAARGRH